MTHAAPKPGRNPADAIAALIEAARALHQHLEDPQAAPPVEPPALADIGDRLGLGRFERQVLLALAASEVDAAGAAIWTRIHGDAARPWPTLGGLWRALPGGSWRALTPAGVLRRWGLIELVGAGPVLDVRVQIDELLLHRLHGCTYLDPRLEPFCRFGLGLSTAVAADDADPPEPWLDEAIAVLGRGLSLATPPVLCFDAGTHDSHAALVGALAARLGARVATLAAVGLPSPAAERDGLVRLLERELRLQRALLWVDARELLEAERQALPVWLDRMQAAVALSCSAPPLLARGAHRIEAPTQDPPRRAAIWHRALRRAPPPATPALLQRLGPVVEQFELTAPAIERIAAALPDGTPAQRCAHLWQAARREARRSLEGLAQRIETQAQWSDLVLPPAALAALKSIVAQLRQRTRVYRDWGFAHRHSRGLGVTALFSGASGTGKTLAAEVLAHELQLDLFRVDLAALVSKYIGETEKNLARLFAAAEAGGAVLLFDEADALFGKRSDVRDSHDRYANIEVSYLLQRMEAYRGLAILTSNLPQALDAAFLRRIRFVVPFPFPDQAARRDIWKGAVPPRLARQLDFDRLSRLSLAGGHIHNVALNAAFLAADNGGRLRMSHLKTAAEAEFAKIDKPPPAAELREWT